MLPGVQGAVLSAAQQQSRTSTLPASQRYINIRMGVSYCLDDTGVRPSANGAKCHPHVPQAYLTSVFRRHKDVRCFWVVLQARELRHLL